MKRLVDTLSQFVSTTGELGKKASGSERLRIATRAQLVEQLQRDVSDARSTLLLWATLNALTFAFLLVAASMKLFNPYITIPAGFLGFVAVARRVESVWRELRLQSLALQMALVTDDERILRDVMVTLNAALLAQTKTRSVEKTHREVA